MTIQEAIDRARALQDTEMSDEEMCRILSAHDEQLLDRVLKKYGTITYVNGHQDLIKLSGGEGWYIGVVPYTDLIGADNGANDFTQDLMIPDRYGNMIYPYLLLLHIDLAHADYERYNNNVQTYSFYYQQMLNDITSGNTALPPDRESRPAKPWAGTQLKF